MPGLRRRFFSSVTALGLVAMWVPAAIVTSAGASGVDAGFEIDGNKVVDTSGNLDWTSTAVGTQPLENDDAGGDPTVYSSSSKESGDPSTWTISGGAPPKDDMTNIYGYAKPGTADVFFAFDRGATSGTDSYYLELNKLQPANTTTYAPNRSEGDLRFRLDDKGNGVIALSSESVWTSGAWVVTTLSSNPAGFDYAVSASESFLEFSFDLTTLLDLHPACPPLFGSLGFRNVTGETGENLKDFIKPLKLSAGSNCGQLKLVKHDANGALLGGATFRITGDPRPVATPAAYLDVLDNGPYDNDPADGQVTVDPVVPGDYTVTEHAAPTGYLIDTSAPSVHVPSSAANSTVPVFVDPPVPPVIRVTKASDPESGSAASPTPVSPGDDITYTLTVHNDALGDASQVPVSDAVPAGTEYVQGSAAATGGTFDSGTNTVSWRVDVAAGHSVDVSFQAHVVETDANGTTIDNTGVFAATNTPAEDCLDPAGGQCHTNTTHHEVEFAVLALAKTADPPTGSIVQRGGAINYTITVSNSGLAAASQVSVVDTLPSNVTLDESSVTPAEESFSGGKLTWLVDVPAAQNGADGVTTITYTVTVDATAAEGETLTNAVAIGGECLGAPAGSDPCTTTHHVPTGDVTLVKHVDQAVAAHGDTLTYTFDAATTGELDQTDVVVSDVVPDGTTYVDDSAACTDAGPCTTAYDAATRTVSWQLGDVANGAPARELEFQVTIDKPSFDSTVGLPAQTITNVGAIVSGETVSAPSNEVKTTIIQVLGIKVVRKPPALPFTGAGLPPVTAVAVASLLIAAGATLVSARRREE